MTGWMQFHDLQVSDILDFAAENHGDTLMASRMGDGHVVHHDYAGLHARARRMAAALAALGVARGQRVATLAWNHHRHFELYYAVPGVGAVIHTINPRVPPEQMAYMLDTAQDRVLCFDTDLVPVVEAMLARAQTKPLLIELCDGEPSMPGALGYERLMNEHAHGADWLRLDEREPFGLCFTSGTTGPPKGVQYTHRSTVLHAMACCSAEAQALSSRETVLPVVPLFHANGWGLPHSAPMVGARLVMPGRRLDATSLLDLCRRESVSFVCGVPTVWQLMLEEIDRTGGTPPSLVRAGMGGSAPSRAMVEKLESLGMDVFHAWGMTETNPGAGTGGLKPRHLAEPLAQRIERKRTQGRPIFGLQRRLVDEQGHDVPRDGRSPGHLMVRGNWVVDRYINSDAPTVDGWFDTGDIGTLDGDGTLRLVDRAKDLIKSGGEWISSIELENWAMACPGVAQVAALGKPDDTWGERPLLVVVVKPGAQADASAVLATMAPHVAKWQLPEEVIFRDTMPLTATGKVDKKALRSAIFG